MDLSDMMISQTRIILKVMSNYFVGTYHRTMVKCDRNTLMIMAVAMILIVMMMNKKEKYCRTCGIK